MKYIKTGIIVLLSAILIYLTVSVAVLPAFHRKAAFAPEPDFSAGEAERVRCIDNNLEALIWRLRLIEEAQDELIFTTYSFVNDESGQDIMAALWSAANRGVRIRMIVDGISADSQLKKSPAFQELAASPNVEVRIYNPVCIWKPWKINYRMHDKVLAADHKAYILGGRNTRNLSLGNYQEKQDLDRDMVVCSTKNSSGNSISQVHHYFEQIWNLKECKSFSLDRTEEKILEQRYLDLKTKYPQAYCPIDWEKETLQTQGVALLTNPVQAQNKEPMLWRSVMQLMEQGNRCIVQTPYAICSSQMYQDLAEITKKNTEVEIVLNSPKTGANFFGCVDYLNQKHHILNTGVTLCEYEGEHSSHAKTVLIDDDICLVGSMNFDMRSAYLDTETMLVIRSPELNEYLQTNIREKTDRSIRFSPDGNAAEGIAYKPADRSVWKTLAYNAARIITPPFRQLF